MTARLINGTSTANANCLKGRGFIKGMDKVTMISKRNQDALAGFGKASSLATYLGQ